MLHYWLYDAGTMNPSRLTIQYNTNQNLEPFVRVGLVSMRGLSCKVQSCAPWIQLMERSQNFFFVFVFFFINYLLKYYFTVTYATYN